MILVMRGHRLRVAGYDNVPFLLETMPQPVDLRSARAKFAAFGHISGSNCVVLRTAEWLPIPLLPFLLCTR